MVKKDLFRHSGQFALGNSLLLFFKVSKVLSGESRHASKRRFLLVFRSGGTQTTLRDKRTSIEFCGRQNKRHQRQLPVPGSWRARNEIRIASTKASWAGGNYNNGFSNFVKAHKGAFSVPLADTRRFQISSTSSPPFPFLSQRTTFACLRGDVWFESSCDERWKDALGSVPIYSVCHSLKHARTQVDLEVLSFSISLFLTTLNS